LAMTFQASDVQKPMAAIWRIADKCNRVCCGPRPEGKESNGLAEREVQEIEGQVRAMKLAFENNIGRSVVPESCVVAFMPECAAYLVNRLGRQERRDCTREE
jgi:hypothetical protein